MSEDKQYRNLLVKRSSAKGQITKFKNYLQLTSEKDELNNIQLTELSLKLSKFEAFSVKFDDLQTDIEVMVPENISVEIEERSIIEEDIIVCIATAKSLFERFSKKHECEQRRHSSHNASCCVDDQPHCHQELELKLPQIQIAKFDGAYFRWLEFRDTFENIIHNNSRISKINKFHYLISYLQGDAARIISNLEVSTQNYDEAWMLLCNRYNNKRLLINHHLSALFNIKQLPRESERSLRFLVDHVVKNLRALSSLGQETEKWGVLIVFMLASKLDANTLLKWEEHRNNLTSAVPTLKEFYKFIIDRADVLESLNRNNKIDAINTLKISSSNVRPTANNNFYVQGQSQTNNAIRAFASTSHGYRKANVFKPFKCIICNENHRIFDCPTFKAKSIDERLADVANHKLCTNCLRQGHSESNCRMGPCPECSQRHNSLLHQPHSSTSHFTAIDEQDEIIVNYSNQTMSHVLLSTAMIEVTNPIDCQKIKVRALLDCGSQSSFISESLKTRLCLKSNPIDSLKVIGIGNASSTKAIESCNIVIQSINTKFTAILSCLVLDELTGRLPKTPIDVGSLNLPDNIKLADPIFYKPAPIDVLIGADKFWDILGNEQRSLGPNRPKLRSSQLGWIVSGPTNLMTPSKSVHCNHASISKSLDEENVDKMLTKFWNLEEIPNKSVMSECEEECERHFLANTVRDECGRFCVRLPLKETADCLGNSYNTAKRRLLSLEKKFKKDPMLKIEYAKFINEYAELGHLSEIQDNDDSSLCYYLPHHAVIKQDSESTKLRAVFDGSAPSTSGYALNDILMVGPTMQDSLFAILVRARQYKYLLTGDIEKMYRQVLVDESDRSLQRILWRDHESEPVRVLQLNTLTYGTASASYLSTRCLWEVGREQDDGLIKNIIQNDFYVDDLITGSDDPKHLAYIQQSVASALRSGCFNLRKYKSNCPCIFDNIEMNHQDNLTISDSASTLGLGWTPSTDTLHFPIKGFSYDTNDVITKRFILSNSFKIFDPLGILSPVVVVPKIILQKLWQQKIDWDEPVPQEIKDDWTKFSDSVKDLCKLQIPRLVLGDLPKYIELHSFGDASQSAYGACIYMRSVSHNGDIKVQLLCAKSKIAPLKPTTIPRLELSAALLAAKLTRSVLDAIRYKPHKIIHWSDSTVVLGWIKGDISKLKAFVANRVSEILEITSPRAWRYVPTDSNPADLISRGVDAKQFASMTIWWTGPNFFNKDESEWPALDSKRLEVLHELKVHSAIISEPMINFERYSSLNKLQRSFAYVQRFVHNIKNRDNSRVGPLSAEELMQSFYFLCTIAQVESFPFEYDLLTKGKPLSNNCKILSLSPFLTNKLIRVGGRIGAADHAFEKRYPILLHGSHRLTKLYFEREHINNMHAGPQLLLATVRESVWPIKGRQLASRTVSNCTRCRRMRGLTLQPKMGNLPPQRVNPDYPFVSVGLDFAGPFTIINRKGRGSRTVKCYLCLFVCLRFKCIHLEAVSDLSKDAFLMTLRRFIARRGKPNEIFCDNGTNFVAASKEIQSFIKQAQVPLCDFASQQSIKFKFIPAYTPHFGGIWEAGVKSAKHHLRRVIGNTYLTFEEISTLFAQVEAILNSRPLCPLSSCPNDLLPLSPGHFLIGRPLTAIPTPCLEDLKDNQLRRYQRIERIRQHFWKRWQREYLSELQQRMKWRVNSANLNVGDMVLLAEDNVSPLAWKLGRVLRLITGPDGIARVAEVTTNKGCVRRSLVRLCRLPTPEELQG